MPFSADSESDVNAGGGSAAEGTQQNESVPSSAIPALSRADLQLLQNILALAGSIGPCNDANISVTRSQSAACSQRRPSSAISLGGRVELPISRLRQLLYAVWSFRLEELGDALHRIDDELQAAKQGQGFAFGNDSTQINDPDESSRSDGVETATSRKRLQLLRMVQRTASTERLHLAQAIAHNFSRAYRDRAVPTRAQLRTISSFNFSTRLENELGSDGLGCMRRVASSLGVLGTLIDVDMEIPSLSDLRREAANRSEPEFNPKSLPFRQMILASNL